MKNETIKNKGNKMEGIASLLNEGKSNLEFKKKFVEKISQVEVPPNIHELLNKAQEVNLILSQVSPFGIINSDEDVNNLYNKYIKLIGEIKYLLK